LDLSLNPSIYAFIFARGGSKGVPNKNIRPFAGKPLIAHAIETALMTDLIHRLFVSTDSTDIARVSKTYGAEIPFIRPKALAGDETPEWLAWRHAVQEIQRRKDIKSMDIFVSLPPTSPFRSVADVDTCIHTFMKGDADMVITVKNATRHPSFNMVTVDNDGFSRLVLPLNKPVFRRQDAPLVYDMTTVAYVTRPGYILSAKNIFEGKVKSVLIPEKRALDIDTELDFAFAEFLAGSKKSIQDSVI